MTLDKLDLKLDLLLNYRSHPNQDSTKFGAENITVCFYHIRLLTLTISIL
jgi:hypothetical protein